MPGPATKMARQVAERTRTLPERVVRASSKEVADALKRQAAADTGGDGRLSNLGGAPLGTKVDLSGSGTLAIAEVIPAKRSRGAWAIVQRGTRPHVIGARRRRRSEALRIGDDWVSGPVHVRGTRGKRTWTRGVQTGLQRAMAAADDEYRKVVM